MERHKEMEERLKQIEKEITLSNKIVKDKMQVLDNKLMEIIKNSQIGPNKEHCSGNMDVKATTIREKPPTLFYKHCHRKNNGLPG